MQSHCIRAFCKFLKDRQTEQRDNGIEGQECDGKLVVNYFDSTCQEKLGYTDYLQMLMPCDQPYLRAAATQRPNYPVQEGELLPYDVERLLVKVVEKEFILAKESEKLKQELAARYDFNVDLLFKEVDDWSYKYIDANNLKRFLIKTSILAKDELLIAILRRLDTDGDAKLTFTEFKQGIQTQKEYTKRQVDGSLKRVLSQNKMKQSIGRSSSQTQLRTSISQEQLLRKKSQQKLNQQSTDQKQFSSKSPTNAIIIQQNLDSQYKTLNSKSSFQSLQINQTIPQTIASPQRYSQEHFVQIEQNLSPLYQEKASQQNQIYQQRSYTYLNAQDGHSTLLYLVRNCLREILAIESGLEQIKRQLYEKRDFSLARIFNIFSDNSQARLTPNDILYGFERLGVVCNLNDAKLFVQRYDSDNDGRLGFWELANAFLTVDPIIRDNLERRKTNWDLSIETKDLVRRAFRQLIDAECMIESIRQKIQNDKTLSLRQAYDQIDWLNKAYINANDLKRTFEQNGVDLHSSQYQSSLQQRNQAIEIEALIRRFNKDKFNGRFSLSEFLEELQPKCHEQIY